MPLSKIQLSSSTGRRNLIINGAMQVAQRATTVGSLTSSNGYHTCDRYRFQLSDLGTWELSQSTESPEEEGFNSSFKLNCTTADTSVAAGSYLIFQQRIEGQNVQHLKYGTSSAESLTFSFWIKSVKTGLVSLEFQHQNSGGTYYNRGATFTINTTNTWEKKIITVPGNTAQNIKDGVVDGLYATFWFTAGTNYTSGTHNTSAWATGSAVNRVSSSGVNFADSTSNEIYITGVQLEVGSTATDFEHRSFAEELLLCKRYYTQIQGGSDAFTFPGKGQGSTTVDGVFPLSVPLRAQPTMNSISSRFFTDSGFAPTTATPTANQFVANNDVLAINIGSYSGGTSFTNNEVGVWGVQAGTLTIDAEL